MTESFIENAEHPFKGELPLKILVLGDPADGYRYAELLRARGFDALVRCAGEKSFDDTDRRKVRILLDGNWFHETKDIHRNNPDVKAVVACGRSRFYYPSNFSVVEYLRLINPGVNIIAANCGWGHQMAMLHERIVQAGANYTAETEEKAADILQSILNPSPRNDPIPHYVAPAVSAEELLLGEISELQITEYRPCSDSEAKFFNATRDTKYVKLVVCLKPQAIEEVLREMRRGPDTWDGTRWVKPYSQFASAQDKLNRFFQSRGIMPVYFSSGHNDTSFSDQYSAHQKSFSYLIPQSSLGRLSDLIPISRQFVQNLRHGHPTPAPVIA